MGATSRLNTDALGDHRLQVLDAGFATSLPEVAAAIAELRPEKNLDEWVTRPGQVWSHGSI